MDKFNRWFVHTVDMFYNWGENLGDKAVGSGHTRRSIKNFVYTKVIQRININPTISSIQLVTDLWKDLLDEWKLKLSDRRIPNKKYNALYVDMIFIIIGIFKTNSRYEISQHDIYIAVEEILGSKVGLWSGEEFTGLSANWQASVRTATQYRTIGYKQYFFQNYNSLTPIADRRPALFFQKENAIRNMECQYSKGSGGGKKVRNPKLVFNRFLKNPAQLTNDEASLYGPVPTEKQLTEWDDLRQNDKHQYRSDGGAQGNKCRNIKKLQLSRIINYLSPDT